MRGGNRSRIGRWLIPLAVVVLADAGVSLADPAASGAAAQTRRVSVSSAGAEANDVSSAAAVSANGRFVAFRSEASNLVARDTNGFADIFVRDRRTGRTTRVSVSSGGAQANGHSNYPAISADGRFVSFSSDASNLVAGDTNGRSDAFVRDRRTGTTRRVSVSSAGAQANQGAHDPALSANGRFVAFVSEASTLVAGDTNGSADIFVRDRRTGTTRRVSVSSAGVQGDDHSTEPALSADGRFVAFTSIAATLVAGDTNRAFDVYVRDRMTGRTTRVSVGFGGAETNGSSAPAAISGSGRFIAFSSYASNLIAYDFNGHRDVFIRDQRARRTTRVNVSSAGADANATSAAASISRDGRFVAFESQASNLVANDTNGEFDIFVRDRRTRTTRRVSLNSSGRQANGSSLAAAISFDGRVVAFASQASNLVPYDENGVSDVFVRGPLR